MALGRLKRPYTTVHRPYTSRTETVRRPYTLGQSGSPYTTDTALARRRICQGVKLGATGQRLLCGPLRRYKKFSPHPRLSSLSSPHSQTPRLLTCRGYVKCFVEGTGRAEYPTSPLAQRIARGITCRLASHLRLAAVEDVPVCDPWHCGDREWRWRRHIRWWWRMCQGTLFGTPLDAAGIGRGWREDHGPWLR